MLDASLELGPESLEEVVDWLGSRKGRNPVVVLDEFQDVLNLPDADTVLAVLRSRIQYHDRIAYIFAGSVHRKLDGIFTTEDCFREGSGLPFREPVFPRLAGQPRHLNRNSRRLPCSLPWEAFKLATQTFYSKGRIPWKKSFKN
jgi:hypothetical protein